MTKADLVERVTAQISQTAGPMISKKDCARVVDAFLDAIKQALERKDGLRLQPTGVYAANLLGLSEQVPAKVVFLTDGASRVVNVGPTQIELKRRTPRHMGRAGRLSGLVVQALRSFGQAHVQDRHVERLRERIPAGDRAGLLDDLALAPAWMHPTLPRPAAA